MTIQETWVTKFTTEGADSYQKEIDRNSKAADKLAKSIEKLKDQAAFENLKKGSAEYKAALDSVGVAQGKFNKELSISEKASTRLAKSINSLHEQAAFETLKRGSTEYNAALINLQSAQGKFNKELTETEKIAQQVEKSIKKMAEQAALNEALAGNESYLKGVVRLQKSQDGLSSSIKKTAAETNKLTDEEIAAAAEAEKLAKASEKMQRRLDMASKAALAMGVNLSDLAGSAKRAAESLIDMGLAGEKSIALEAQFKRMGGTSAELTNLRNALGNLVPDNTIRQMANMSRSFGISGENLTKFAKIALGASRKLGTDATAAFSDIVVGTARGSKQILDNLGIMIKPLKEVNAAYAKQHGIVGALTDRQKQLAMQQEVIRVSADNLTAANIKTANSITKMSVAWENFKDKVAVGVANTVDKIGKTWDLLDKKLNPDKVRDMTFAMKQFAEIDKQKKIGKLESDINKLEGEITKWIEATIRGEVPVKALNTATTAFNELIQEKRVAINSLNQPMAALAGSLVSNKIKLDEATESQIKWNLAINRGSKFAAGFQKAVAGRVDEAQLAADFLLKIEEGREKRERERAERRAQRRKEAAKKRREEVKKAQQELIEIRDGAFVTELKENDQHFNNLLNLVGTSHANITTIEKARLKQRFEIHKEHFGSIGELASKALEDQRKEMDKTQANLLKDFRGNVGEGLSALKDIEGILAQGKESAFEEMFGFTREEFHSDITTFADGIASVTTRVDALKSSFSGEEINQTAASVLGAFEVITSGVEPLSQALLEMTDANATSSDVMKAGIMGVTQAVGAGVDVMIKDEKKRAAFKAVLEAAESIASFAFGDIRGGILHGLAAIKFGAIAGGAAGITNTRAESNKAAEKEREKERKKRDKEAKSAQSSSPSVFTPRRSERTTQNIFISQFGEDTQVGMAMLNTVNGTLRQNSGAGFDPNGFSSKGRFDL
jgi:hypothetical protein